MLKFLNQNKYILIILCLGLILRIYGIDHGFPFIYNVDEPALVRSATQIRFDPNPKHFDWPHLHFYLNFFLFSGFSLFRSGMQFIGVADYLKSAAPILWRDPLVFYLLARIFDALIGTLTIYIVYLIGKNLFEKKYGLFAALALAVFPYHVWASHFALIDIPMTFWFSLSLLFSVYIAKQGLLKHYILAGLFAGFSASTKYNGGFAVFVIFLCHLMLLKNKGLLTFDLASALFNKYSRNLVVSAMVSLVGFFIGTPYAFLDYKTFSINDSPKGAYWQFKNVGKVDSSEYLEQLGGVLSTRFIDEFGFTYLLIFEVYVFYFLVFKRDQKRLLIVLPGLFYFLYVTSFDKNRMHYYMLTFPFIVLMVSDISAQLYNLLSSKLGRVAILVVLGVVFLAPVATSLSKVNFLAQKDTRNIAYGWIVDNIKPGEKIYYSGGDLDAVMADSKIKAKKIGSLNSNQLLSGDVIAVASNQLARDVESLDSLLSKSSIQLSIENQGNRPGPNIYVLKIN